MNILAIDPGNIMSGVSVIDADDYKPLCFGKFDNMGLLEMPIGILYGMTKQYAPQKVVIEMVGHYGTGMAAGKTVFDTCVAIGRFKQWLVDNTQIDENDIELVLRKHYITELTGSPKAKDANVIQYLIDRFAPDTPNRGKGTKNNRGWFYGFKADVWQSYALGVYYIDKLKGIVE